MFWLRVKRLQRPPGSELSRGSEMLPTLGGVTGDSKRSRNAGNRRSLENDRRLTNRYQEAGRGAAALVAWLREARRRARRGAARIVLVRVGFYCLLVAACGLLVARILYRSAAIRPDAAITCSESPALAVGLVALSCFLVWAAAYLFTRPSLLRVARQADAHFSLDDRLPTALECMSGRATLLSPLLIEDAAARIRALDPPWIGPKRQPLEARLLPLAVAALLAASALDVAYPAFPVHHEDRAVREESELLESVVESLEDRVPSNQDSRWARSLLHKAEELARDMRTGAAGTRDAVEGLAGLLEELTLRGLDTKPQPGEGLHRADQQGPRKTSRPGGLTNVLDYGDDIESLRRDITSLKGHEMSPDETATLAKKLEDLARKVGEDSALGERAREVSEALGSDAATGRDEAIEEFLREAERAFSPEETVQPMDREAMEELKEAIARAHRSLEERLSRTGSGEQGQKTGPEDEEEPSGGEISKSGAAPPAPPTPEQEEGKVSAPGTERGGRSPGPPAQRQESGGPVYPVKGMPGQGEVRVTTVLGPGSSGGASQAQNGEPHVEVEVEESAAVREQIPAEYRSIVERYFK